MQLKWWDDFMVIIHLVLNKLWCYYIFITLYFSIFAV